MLNKAKILVILDHTNENDRAAADIICSEFADKYLVILASGSNDGTQLPDEMIVKSSPEYFHELVLADMVLVFGGAAKLTRYEHRQLVWSFLDYTDFAVGGASVLVPFAHRPRAHEYHDRSLVRHYVYDAPRSDVGESYGLRTLFDTTPTLAEMLTLALGEIDRALSSLQCAQETIILLTNYQDTVHTLDEPISTLLAEKIATGQTRVVCISKQKSRFSGRIPHTAFYAFDTFQKHFRGVDFPGRVTVVYDNAALLAPLQLIRPDINYIDALNLNLIDYSSPLSNDAFENLARDPSEFYKDRLLSAYKEHDVAYDSVTIIIPHYNTDLWKLERCLRSAIACKDRHAATQVMLIDDGSKVDIKADIQKVMGPLWEQIDYYHKPNAGLGPTRNYGVEKSTAEFVYFLDSDDEIIADHLPLLLAEAAMSQVDAVVGKRILCTPDGSFLSDSLDYIFEGVRRQVTARDQNIFDDLMANNKLIRRSAFIEKNLWFDAGLYEDNVFTVRMYNALKSISFLNFAIHKWYQYGAGESITKTVSFDSVRWKIQSLINSWVHLDAPQRMRRIKYNVANDLYHYLKLSVSLDTQSRKSLADMARDYVAPRAEMLNVQWDAFAELLETVEAGEPPAANVGVPQHKHPTYVFYVRTHFHMLSAMVHTMHFKYDAILIMDSSTASFRPLFVDAVRRTKIFQEVRTCTSNAIYSGFINRVRLGSQAPLSIFDTLFREYDKHLGDLDPEATGVFFHDHLPEVYFMGRHFKSVMKFEDGYQSTNREMVLSTDDGIWGQLSVICKAAYAEAHPTARNLERVVSSHAVDRSLLTPEYAAAQVVLQDFKALALECRKPLERALKIIYGEIAPLDYNATLIFTQPLYHNFCTLQEHLAVVAYMVEMTETPLVYIKPHPSDHCDYAALGLPVIGAKVPFEYFETVDQKVKRAITFGSSALVGSTVVEEVSYLFPLEGFTGDEVRAKLQHICYEKGAMALERAKILQDANTKPNTAMPAKNHGTVRRKATAALKRIVGPHRMRQLKSVLRI